MALDGTYSGLQASIARWLTREDLTDVIPDFIKLAESRLNDRLRLAPMEKTVSLAPEQAVILIDEDTGDILIDETTGDTLTDEDNSSIVVGTVVLPDDFLEMRMLLADVWPRRTLKLISPNRAIQLYGGWSGWPDTYTIIGNVITTAPTTTYNLLITYYARIPALTDAAPSNWLLTRYPQMYLYASLLEAAPVLYDDQRVVLWKAALDEAIGDAKMSDLGTRYSNAALRLAGATP